MCKVRRCVFPGNRVKSSVISSVFAKAIEPELERIPVLEVVHREERDGQAFLVHQTVSRNVFTAFDLKLSRHLTVLDWNSPEMQQIPSMEDEAA